MSDTPAPSADLTSARWRFFDQGEEPTGLVDPAILRSWRRCAERGLDSHEAPRIEPAGSMELREITERNERLLRFCRPEIDTLSAAARDSGGLVVLTDGAGFVLDAIGDTGFAGKAARVALRPGARWAEAATGTNAIGAALFERRPVEVRGAEHFFDAHRILTCAAAPILDPRGALVGALDLSAGSETPQSHALSLIRMGVDQIEHRMFSEGFETCDVVRLHSDPGLLGTAREGVLAFEGARLVAANRHALKLLGLEWNALGARTFADVFDAGRTTLSEEGRLRTRSGEVLHARLKRPEKPIYPVRMPEAPAPVAPAPHVFAPVFDASVEAGLARAARLVDGDVPILIHGETGVGKELFARAVHAACGRASKAFVAVNCAALPEGLIEAELFGYEPGAYTGARKAGSKGLLREAESGVLFLDEIGDMPLALQARLLRVVQERVVTPLGGGKPQPLDLRLICATHRDLKSLSASEAFRSDLYFRLAQFTFSLPALRDLPDRAGLIEAVWRQLPIEGRTLEPATLDRLAAYDWPGNHRELVGVLKAAVALSEPDEAVGPAMLPSSVAIGTPAAPAAVLSEGSLDQMARSAMLAAIDDCGGNVAAAARKLGVSRSTLYRRALGTNG